MKYNKKIVFENGREFAGVGFGADVETVKEVVFNTAMVGYQEVMSDPSYCGQIVCMTYPIIGSYGLAEEDYETKTPKIGGFIVRDYNDSPSNFRYTKTLAGELEENNIPAISGVDTRMITRMIRDEGAMRAILTDIDTPTHTALERIKAEPVMHDHVKRVTSKKIWYSRTPNYRYNVVVVDCGVKYSIIKKLNEKGCNVIIVPYDTSYEDVMALRPDGVFFSNGPGDPTDVPEAIELVRKLQGNVPVFGICLGHQIIALANGATTYKMKFGHKGGNHPVKNLLTGKVEITSQNHSYVVDTDSVKGTKLKVTHVNLLDNTIEGFRCADDMILSVQYHPESAPGPQESSYLFDSFIDNMKIFMAKGGAR